MAYIHINEDVTLDTKDIEWEFFRSSGPGGQNVNKVSTGVRIKYNISESSTFSDDTKSILLSKLEKKIVNEYLVVESKHLRTQSANRKDALARLKSILISALQTKKDRFVTTPTSNAREARLREKKHKSRKKKERRYDECWY